RRSTAPARGLPSIRRDVRGTLIPSRAVETTHRTEAPRLSSGNAARPIGYAIPGGAPPPPSQQAHASSKVSRGCPAPNLDWTFGSPAAMIAPGSVRDGPSAHGRGLLRNADAGGAIMHVQDSSWAGDWGLVPLRLAVGRVFVVHGAQKLFVFGFGGAAGFMAKVGIPLPSVAAVVVTAVEILGGLALVLGLGTRVAAALLAFEMLVAILTVRRSEARRVGKASRSKWAPPRYKNR